MNKQVKTKNGLVTGRGIEWTDYTWNPVAGCHHGCSWKMPDGSIAECYAKTVAESVAQAAYPDGFANTYWHPERLAEPGRIKIPSRIFLDSMSDLMDIHVTDDQVNQVLETCEKAPWHQFQLLTKNAPRLKKFKFPKNIWVGASLPPSFMFGKELNHNQQEEMLARTLMHLGTIKSYGNKVWVSFEPLSWDCAHRVRMSDTILDWAVIGAATNGRKTFQPEKFWVDNLLNALDYTKTAVFFKGNLEWPIDEWREEFPR